MSDAGSLEYPRVSELATEQALKNVLGGWPTNNARYGRYQAGVQQRQPQIWEALPVHADFYARVMRLSEAPLSMNNNAFAGGGLLYLASAERQAELDGRALAEVSETAAKRALAGTMTLDDSSVRTLPDALTAFTREVGDKDLERLAKSTTAEIADLIDETEPQYRASIDNSPFANEFKDSVRQAADSIVAGIGLRVLEFTTREPEFCKIMREWQWQRVHTEVATCQIMGAAAVRAMIAVSEQMAQ